MTALALELLNAHPLLVGGVGVAWLTWLTLAVLYAARQSPRALRHELEQLSLEHSDLVARFTRFQKREGMRYARDQASVLEQAQELLQQQQHAQRPAAEVVPDASSPEFKTWLRKRAHL